MGCLSVKTLCKGIAILFFVNLQGLNAQDNGTAFPVTTSSSSTQTSPQTPVTTPPASTSSSVTESQTSAHSTFPVTTSSSSTQTSPQTSVTTPPASTSSSATESQTSTDSTPPASTSSSATESQTSAHSTFPVTTSSSSTQTSPQTSVTTPPASTSSSATESQTSAHSTFPVTTSSSSTQTSPQTSVTTPPASTSSSATESQTSTDSTPPASTSSSATESQTSAHSTPPASTSSSATESQTSAHSTFPVTTSSSSTQTSPQTSVTTPPASTSSSATESQTSTDSTFPVTTSSSSTQTSPQTSVTTPPASTSSSATESQTSAHSTPPAYTSSSATESQTSAHSTFPVTTSSSSTQTSPQTSVTTPPASTSSSTSAHSTFLVTTSSSSTQTSPQTPVTKPNVTGNLTVSEVTTSSVFLSWNEPIGNRSFFKVKWTNKTQETSNTSHNITDLTAGVNYTFCITAVAADNSTEGNATCISQYTKPDVIMNLTADDITTSSVLLNWTKPNGESSHYHVEYEDKNVTTENTSIKINDLISGAQYTFKVFAVSADHVTEGRSIQISLYTKPNVIGNLTVSEVTTSSVFLSWNEPIGNRSFFKVKWTNKTKETSNTSHNITDLTAGFNYTFCITAVAADNSTEGGAICISQYTKPNVIGNLTVSEVTTLSVFLSWNEPTGNRSFFKVKWTNKTKETSNTSHNITDLTAGVNYTFCITAVAADNSTEGDAICISQYTKPDVIMNLTADDITTSSVLLNWTKPNGESSRYCVEYEDKNVTTENTSIKINYLVSGAQYTLKVFAISADHVTEGRSIQISLYTKPNVTGNLTVSEVTTSSVFLSWNEPIGNRSFFKVKWTNKTKETSNTSHNITDLTAGVNYTFCITAVAADNSTEGDAICISQYTKPDVIMNLTADDITTSSVLLNWTKPNGESSRYCVEYEDKNVTTENTSIKINYLVSGAQYTFKVFAISADHVTEGRSIQISLYTKPNVTGNLTVSEVTTLSVFLSWNEPTGNRSFFKVKWTDKTKETSNTSHNITDLTAGVSYTFCITAVAADNSTEGDAICISQYTKPNVIQNLRVSEFTTLSVFLSWHEPIGNRSFFKVKWTNKTKETSNTSHNITDLTAGVSYTFCITAVAADNSTEGDAICISQYTKPDVIMNLTADDITTSSVLLNWTKPNGESSHYHVEYEDKNVTTENTSIKINDLISGAQYTFKVFAVSADHVTEGRSIQISLYTKPNVTGNLTVSEVTTSSVFLSWNEPIGNRSFFKVKWTNKTKETSNTSHHITDLTAGVNYTFCITAVAADNSTEGDAICISQYTKPDVIMNLTADDITTSSVLLNWTKPNGQSSRYRVEYEDKNVTTESTSIKINDLISGAQYTFKVFAVSADHVTEGRSIQISLYTKPNVTGNLIVSEVTTLSVFLSWNEPIGNRSFFKVKWTDKTKETSNTSLNITDLTAGVSYTFCITAVAADNSTEGDAICISQYTKPDVIMNLTADDITTSSILLNWTKPNGQSSRYRVEYDDKNVTTENTSIKINDLISGAQYTFKVFAVSADHVTEGRSIQISLYTKPNVIGNLTVSEVTTLSVFLSWNEPTGNRSFFKVKWTNKTKETSNTSHNITDLTAGVNYTFCITAVAADNSTEGGAICISQYTKPDVIMNLTADDITASSVLLNWTKPNGESSRFRVEYEDKNVTTESTSIKINYLISGAQYTFKVFAISADHVTEGRSIQISLYTKPNVIRNLIVSEVTTSSVFLSWNEPIGNRSFFKVKWTNKTKETSNTSHNITDLTAGVSYTFCITAVAADNSTEGGAICISQYTKPDVIMNLTADDITTSSVLLNWTKPNGQSSRYRVEYEDKNVTTENTSVKMNYLVSGAQYTFKVFAVSADHVTEGRSNQISLYTKPNVIGNLTVSEVTTLSVFLSWKEPIGNRSFFKVKWTDKTKETSNTSHNITDLTAGVNYTFCITAVAADNSTEGDAICISQYTKPSVTGNLTVSEVTTLSVFLSWNEPIGNRSFFKVKWTNKTKETSNTSHNITDLTAGVSYTFCITAVAADNSTEGDATCISQYTKPDVIMNLTADDITTSSVLLNWTKPNGESSRYCVEYEDKNVTTENTSIKINYLVSGAQYTFKVFAISADHVTEGRSIQISLYTKPNVTGNLTVSEVTTSSVFLSWNEPIGNRSFFKVKWTNKTKETSNTSHHITDLTAGVNYTFCITAVAADNSTEGDAICISQYTKSSGNNTGPNIWLIVGIVVAVICFLFIISLIFIYSRSQKKKQCPDFPLHIISKIASRIEDYEDYFIRNHADSNCGFAKEYEELKSVGTAQPRKDALAFENKTKNRYTNVLPYDASRVKLSMCGNPFDDYINASYIPGYKSREEFIAAQGPLSITVNEFWRMIWEKNIYTIVMLTKCNEQGEVKCEKYWPSGTNHYHNISVTTTSEITLESWTIRDFGIKNEKTEETRNIRQFHFTAWPDNGVPQTTEVLIDFRQLVRKHMDQYSRHSPTVVHCSAGVGRTGAFIAIDHLIFQIERDSMVDVYGIVTDMHMHRPLMVQTEEQYVYLHQCAYDIIRSRTGTKVDLIYQNTAAPPIYENPDNLKQ
ncbi:receptor-type tyrosine-protein phosphatase eta isoform X5 [Ctenopharyngodon idella]|uniref:receptor-type tyrosine-protein phosphatase eta isoform X5 n=1 Tax=Ctenopharyngodon idella TaxID=7959 RepID=UPI00223165D2|nr:receptor-type tyrosine-protein phosphatase eta isoform X5 [Ctenopharyngodon idella]